MGGERTTFTTEHCRYMLYMKVVVIVGRKRRRKKKEKKREIEDDEELPDANQKDPFLSLVCLLTSFIVAPSGFKSTLGKFYVATTGPYWRT